MKRAEAAGECLVKVASVGIVYLVLSSSQAAEQQPGTPAGTYEVRICKKACAAADDERVVAKGYVVLFDAALEKDVLARLRLTNIEYLSSNPVNACFQLQKMQGRAYNGHAGIEKSGLTAWVAAGDELRFLLMSSPDAGYGVSLRPTATGLEGKGISFGAGVAAPWPWERGSDYVALRRVGDSDVRRCEQMVRPVGAAQELRYHVRSPTTRTLTLPSVVQRSPVTL